MQTGASGLSESSQALLEQRGIEIDLVLRLGWRSVTGKGGGEWVEIPFYRDGKIVNRKYRTFGKEKKFFQSEGGEQCFYNLEAIRSASRDEPLVITEGECDAVIALQCGFLAVSVPGGAPGKPVEDKDSTRYDFLEDLPNDIPVILAVDNDAPGAALFHDLTLRIGKHRCRWVKYPPGCKDLNDVFIKTGAGGVERAVRASEWVPVGGVYRLSELPPVPKLPALSCGIQGMSEHWLLRPGDLSVVTGIPSMGKTTVVNEVMCNMAKVHGWKTAVASFEQNPRGDHLRYMRTYYTRTAAHNMTEADPRVLEADEWVDKHFVFIYADPLSDDKNQIFDLEWLLERCQQAVLRDRVQLIIIDPWNELDHVRPYGMSLTEYVGNAIKTLKRFAAKYAVHIIVVAHPAKMEKNKDGEYGIPSLYDISDSANWYNKPDIGIVVHRNRYNLTIIRVQKVRYIGVIGRPGDITLRYEDAVAEFLCLSQDEIDAIIARKDGHKKTQAGLPAPDKPAKRPAKRGKKKSDWEELDERDRQAAMELPAVQEA